MSKPIQLSIPTPCHENWQQMTPVERGRFCASCQKKVFDFANMPDSEIVSVLRSHNHVCGRLTAKQLKAGVKPPKEKSLIGVAATAAAITLLTAGANDAIAQEPVRTVQAPFDTTTDILGKIRVILPKTHLVHGIIYDEQQRPLQHIIVTDTITQSQVETDADGLFALKAQQGEVLKISGIGFTTQYITIENQSEEMAIVMKGDGMVLGQIIYERTFFGHIFHWIGNLFR